MFEIILFIVYFNNKLLQFTFPDIVMHNQQHLRDFGHLVGHDVCRVDLRLHKYNNRILGAEMEVGRYSTEFSLQPCIKYFHQGQTVQIVNHIDFDGSEVINKCDHDLRVAQTLDVPLSTVCGYVHVVEGKWLKLVEVDFVEPVHCAHEQSVSNVLDD